MDINTIIIEDDLSSFTVFSDPIFDALRVDLGNKALSNPTNVNTEQKPTKKLLNINLSLSIPFYLNKKLNISQSFNIKK